MSDIVDQRPGELSALDDDKVILLPDITRSAGERRSVAARFQDESFSTSRVADDSRATVALANLRGMFVLVLLAFHGSIAYVAFATPPVGAFASPPFAWRAFPIVDTHRFLAFDIFCAWQDVYLMGLMFFVSGLFVAPSLARKGSVRFLRYRLSRLGGGFLVGVLIVIPIALYPAYRVTATTPSLAEYARDYLSLPFLPNGQVWFLWLLFAFTLVVAALHRAFPEAISRLGHLAARSGAAPSRGFLILALAAAVAYVPLALAFSPWSWNDHGLFSFQLSRPLLYGVFYIAGLAVGAHGRERGLLDPAGALGQRWRAWGGLAAATLFVWMGLTGWSRSYAQDPPLALALVSDVSYALAATASLYFMLSLCMRFGAARVSWLDGLSRNAMTIYVLHYAPLVWLQFALMNVDMPSFVKVAIVFAGTLACCLAMTKAWSSLALGARPARRPSVELSCRVKGWKIRRPS
jgi:hypothetical protein